MRQFVRKKEKKTTQNRFCVDFPCIDGLIKNCISPDSSKSCVSSRVES